MKNSDALEKKYAAIIHERTKHTDQPIVLFCKNRGVKPQSFYYWKNKLTKSKDSSSTQNKFVPVKMPVPAPFATMNDNHFYEIRFPNGSQVNIPCSIAVDTLTQVLHSVATFRV